MDLSYPWRSGKYVKFISSAPTTVGVEGALFELSHLYLGISVLQGLIWSSYIYSILVWPLIG